MARFDFWRGSRYTRIPSQFKTPELDETKVHMRDCLTTRVRWCIVFVIVVLAGLGGFTLGLSIAGEKDTVPEWTHSLLRGKALPKNPHQPAIAHCSYLLPTVHVGWTKQTFQYNKTFGAASSADESTEGAWDAIVPRNLCFTRCEK